MFPVIDLKVLGARVAQVALIFALGFLVYRGEPSNQASGVPPPIPAATSTLCRYIEAQQDEINKAVVYGQRAAYLANIDSAWLRDNPRNSREARHFAYTASKYDDLVQAFADLRGINVYCDS